MKIALSLLCENPNRLTGLASVFREVINRSLPAYPDLNWIVFSGPGLELSADGDRVTHIHCYPGNDRLAERLVADHFRVGPHASRLGADGLVTVGFVPIRSAGLPVVMHLLTLHHLANDNRIGSLRSIYRRWSAERGLKRADLVITNSSFAADQILTSSPAPPKRMVISNEGIDHEIFQPNAPASEIDLIERELGIRPGYLLWISNLYPYKQPSLLLEIFATLPEALRRKYPLVFVGGDWEGQRAILEDLAVRLNLRNEVKFLGWIPEHLIAPVYRHARAHVLASLEETWGRTVTEAMACGCPCIVNDIPVMKEVTEGHAVIVDFADRPAASTALEAILTDDALRNRLQKNGLKRASALSFDRLTHERMREIIEVMDKSRQDSHASTQFDRRFP
jgi:glycosyltransferase involved in cell wall biosynthesis